MNAAPSHLVLIPSYNTGRRLASTVAEALRFWSPVWVVVDGSTDGSDAPVRELAGSDSRVRVIALPRNCGKGAAIEAGVEAALAAGFTHALTMDADGQHPANLIPEFMAASLRQPEAMILGRPIFGPEAPAARRQGRKLSVAMARLEVLGAGIDDPLFGFRVYPLEALRRVFAETRWARRFDFDHEVTVRAFWNGTPPVNLPAPCRYLSRDEGGVSHFRYVRDNCLLVWLQLRLLAELVFRRWPQVVRLRWRRRHAALRPAHAVSVLALLVLLCAPPAKAAATTPIAPDDGRWTALLDRLRLRSDRETTFVERRYLPFRRAPLVLRGEVRLSPAHGLSLDYEAPQRRTIVVDSSGVLVRSPGGTFEPMPSDSRIEGAVTTLLSVLRFDALELFRRFQVSGSEYGSAWTLELRPRTAEDRAAFAAVLVSGQGAHPTALQLIKSASEHIDIALGPEAKGADFGPGVIARYFR